MGDRTPEELAREAGPLLAELDRIEPISWDLGTPAVVEVEPVQRLIALGPAIVPLLLEQLEEEASEKRIAHVVLVLSHLADATVLPDLIALRSRYQGRGSLGPWDYAVLGQCNVAIERLRAPK